MASPHSSSNPTGSNPKPSATPLLKFSVQFNRKEGITEEAFTTYMNTVQMPRAAPVIKKHGIVKYSLFLCPSPMRAAFGDELVNQLDKPTWKMTEFDAMTSYWVRSPDDLRALLADPEWEEKVTGPEAEWIDMETVVVLTGFETTYVEGGELV
ncbi:hypothetical protein QBC34DRAFT_463111 [Podospora aff. communis PSN243]|uniref:EthD domain-containing protein n=1 Tax=Podospora aff. communis PSN243 TaxID=3040156 RepID=A0AAV9GNC2_9PEZI|nr:hypothetical protein QBC34DRAFT_463111 [Podospora aff. communis PSN243]